MCWGFKDVYLEEPPKKTEEAANNNEYIMVSSELPAPAAPVSHVLLHGSLILTSRHFTLSTLPTYLGTCVNFHRSST